MKQLTFFIIVTAWVLTGCNNKSGQVTNASDDPVNIVDDSTGQVTDTSNVPVGERAEQIVDTTQQYAVDPIDGESQDAAQEIIETTKQYTTSPTDDVIPDPAEIIIGGDPLEGINTEEVINPAHGKPGHRCDFPVGSDIGLAPPTIGMSLCE